jgi:CBS domain containing-hemolysin-like protein
MPDTPDAPSSAPPNASRDAEPPSRITLREKLARLIGGATFAQAQAVVASEIASPNATPSAMRLRLAEFETATVRDVMTSRADVAAIDVDATLGDVFNLFVAQAHSRMPVYHDSLDEPLGFVHIKDVVAEVVRGNWSAETLASRPLKKLMRDIMFVTESTRLPDLLVQMQTKRMHIAIVLDEYGGAGGIVCLEDLVEQIVGEIVDEHDEAAPLIQRRGRNTWDIDGLAEVSAVERATGLPIRVEEYEDSIDTMGGLVAAIAGRLPQPGEVIDHPTNGRVFEVLNVDPRRITRLRLRRAIQQAGAVAPLAAGAGAALDRREA